MFLWALPRKECGEIQHITSSMNTTDMHCPVPVCLFACTGSGIEIAGVYNDRRLLGIQEAGM